MAQRQTQLLSNLLPEALSASQVGVWETDFGTDRTIADATTAILFGLDPQEAAEGLPLAAYARAILPADREEFMTKIGRVHEQGGLFVVEYRVCSTGRDVRWVLARGTYSRNLRTGQMVGRGIVIDITESKLDGQAGDRACFIQTQDETPLERIAANALQVRHALDDYDGPGHSILRVATDVIIWEAAHLLAKRSGSD